MHLSVPGCRSGGAARRRGAGVDGRRARSVLLERRAAIPFALTGRDPHRRGVAELEAADLVLGRRAARVASRQLASVLLHHLLAPNQEQRARTQHHSSHHVSPRSREATSSLAKTGATAMCPHPLRHRPRWAPSEAQGTRSSRDVHDTPPRSSRTTNQNVTSFPASSRRACQVLLPVSKRRTSSSNAPPVA